MIDEQIETADRGERAAEKKHLQIEGAKGDCETLAAGLEPLAPDAKQLVIDLRHAGHDADTLTLPPDVVARLNAASHIATATPGRYDIPVAYAETTRTSANPPTRAVVETLGVTSR